MLILGVATILLGRLLGGRATGLCLGCRIELRGHSSGEYRRVRHQESAPMSKRDQKCGPTGVPSLDALREAGRDSRFKLYVEVTIHFPSLGSVSRKTLEISERGLSATLSVDLPIGEVVELAPKFNIGPVKRPRYGPQQEGISPRLPICRAQSRTAPDPGKLLLAGADT
jgi:hypothetical protein